MHFAILLSFAIFSAVSLAQFHVDASLVSAVVSKASSFLSSLHTNPTLIADIPQIEALGVPASAISAAAANPDILLENLVADYTNTALIAIVPTALGNSLRSLLAQPLKAVVDIEDYLQKLLADPFTGPALEELKKEVPASVQLELEQSPIPFLRSLVEATTVPAFFSAVPTAVQNELAAILNVGLKIVLDDLEGPAIVSAIPVPTGTGPKPTPAPSGVFSSGRFSFGHIPSGHFSSSGFGFVTSGGYNATTSTGETGRYVCGPRPTSRFR